MKHFLYLLCSILFCTQSLYAQCPAAITDAAATSAAATCPANGSITVSSNVSQNTSAAYQIIDGPRDANGQPLEYSTATQNSNVFQALPAGTYTIRITCGSATTTVTTTVANSYTAPTLSVALSNVCTNRQPGGTITATATGSATPLLYAFVKSDNPAIDDSQLSYGTSNVFNTPQYGTYQVRVRDACNAFVTRTVEISPTARKAYIQRVNSIPSSTDCNTVLISTALRDSVTNADISPTNSGYLMEVYDLGTSTTCTRPAGASPLLSRTINASSDLAFSLPATVQNILIRTVSPCGQTAERCAYNVNTRPPLGINSVQVFLSCLGNDPAGTAEINIAFGTARPPLTVRITPSGGSTLTFTSTSSNATFSNLPYSSSYLIEVSDACGGTASRTVRSPQQGTNPFVATRTLGRPCPTNEGNYQVKVSFAGYAPGLDQVDDRRLIVLTNGPGGPLATPIVADAWSVFFAEATFNNLAPGAYSGYIETPDARCGNLPFSFVADGGTTYPPVRHDLTGSVRQLCGGTGTITGSVIYNGPNSNTFVLTGPNGTTQNTSGTFTNLPAGTYTLRSVINRAACAQPNLVDSTQLTISAAGTPVTVQKKLGVVCEDAGGAPTNSGSAYLSLTGSEPFKVEIKRASEPATAYVTRTTTAGSSYNITDLAAGEVYSIRVTDDCGTSVVTDVTIEQLGQLSIQNTQQPCVGTSYVLRGPDEPGATYQWVKDGTVISTSRDLTFNPYQSQNDGTYVVNVVFGNCVRRSATTTLNSTRCNLPLPVQLKSFTATAVGCGTRLAWETTAEKNFREFVIERSSNAREFEAVGRTLSAGNADGSRYVFAQNGLDGTYYYRLKMVDNDNSFTLSRVQGVSVRCGQVPALKVYPSPAVSGGPLSVQISQLAYKGQGRVEIHSVSGRLLYSQPVQLDGSSRAFALAAGPLPAGQYVLSLKKNGHEALAEAVSFLVQ